jgi:hypothetical protein
MSKETTRLTVCPFDWIAQMDKEDEKNLHSWRHQMDDWKKKWEQEHSWWDKICFTVWHHHVKLYVEPFYPWRIKQAIKWWFQRRTRGFDDSDMWGLDYSLAKLILPRLQVFYKRAQDPRIISGYPIDLDPCYPSECNQNHDPNVAYKNWLKILKDMCYSFESIILEEECFEYDAQRQTDWVRLQRGLNYFSTYYRNLWE